MMKFRGTSRSRTVREWACAWSLATLLLLSACTTGRVRSTCRPCAPDEYGTVVTEYCPVGTPPCGDGTCDAVPCRGLKGENGIWLGRLNGTLPDGTRVSIGDQLTEIECLVRHAASNGDEQAALYCCEIKGLCYCNRGYPGDNHDQTSMDFIRSAWTKARSKSPQWFSVRDDLNAADN